MATTSRSSVWVMSKRMTGDENMRIRFETWEKKISWETNKFSWENQSQRTREILMRQDNSHENSHIFSWENWIIPIPMRIFSWEFSWEFSHENSFKKIFHFFCNDKQKFSLSYEQKNDWWWEHEKQVWDMIMRKTILIFSWENEILMRIQISRDILTDNSKNFSWEIWMRMRYFSCKEKCILKTKVRN